MSTVFLGNFVYSLDNNKLPTSDRLAEAVLVNCKYTLVEFNVYAIYGLIRC